MLPDGGVTHSARAYAKAWRDLARPLARRFKWRLYAFDPDLEFCRQNSSGLVRVPRELAVAFNALEAENAVLRRRGGPVRASEVYTELEGGL